MHGCKEFADAFIGARAPHERPFSSAWRCGKGCEMNEEKEMTVLHRCAENLYPKNKTLPAWRDVLEWRED